MRIKKGIKDGGKTMQKRTLTTDGVSEIYQISKGTLANLRWQRRGPRFYKVGKRVLYFIEDIERWIKAEPVLTRDSLEDSE